MTELVKHYNPIGKGRNPGCLAPANVYRASTAAGHILDLRIVTIYETTAINGLPLDFLIAAQKTRTILKQFGVIFSESPRTGLNTASRCFWYGEGISRRW